MDRKTYAMLDDKGRLCLDVFPLMESLTLEEKRHVADALACDDDVITFVVQQIIGGWTEFDSHAGKCYTTQSVPHSGLDKACRDIAKASGEIARKEIERLEKALGKAEAEVHSLRAEIHEMNPTWRL